MFYLGGILLQLVISTSSEGISADKTRFPAFLLVVIGKLSAGGCLPRALQPNHHDHVRSAFHWHVGLHPWVHQLNQLGKHCLLYELPLVVTLGHLLEVNARPNILSEGFH